MGLQGGDTTFEVPFEKVPGYAKKWLMASKHAIDKLKTAKNSFRSLRQKIRLLVLDVPLQSSLRRDESIASVREELRGVIGSIRRSVALVTVFSKLQWNWNMMVHLAIPHMEIRSNLLHMGKDMMLKAEAGPTLTFAAEISQEDFNILHPPDQLAVLLPYLYHYTMALLAVVEVHHYYQPGSPEPSQPPIAIFGRGVSV
ncbi:hypothetical protein BJ684DRAFT_21429 [Piptocephalis cylindrospora]|uniref:Uncharacterized protein n=1 Tax=Piptocephalis cylindrospora TaxID=1907219 RepID=A0A4P9Y0K2_9FUNG|nr:hypothetical protein BJ684DRAFT_21429 [Piptocephalis cylindrospora]|eukprot:RKP12002.1 hypothetical protein BJ684DRAFT_21429 [Piptocephalis cylindrospora]